MTMADVTSSPKASASNDTRTTFPFFKLPPELRDGIYDLSLVRYPPDSHDTTLKCGLRLTARDIAATNLLLVSKDFNHEYTQWANSKSKLVITDTCEWNVAAEEVPALELPTPAFKVFGARFELALDDDWFELWQGPFVAKFLERALKSPNFSILSMRINYNGKIVEGEKSYDLVKMLNELLGEWDVLKGVDVFERDDATMWRFGGNEGFCYRMSWKTGRLVEAKPEQWQVEFVDEDEDENRKK